MLIGYARTLSADDKAELDEQMNELIAIGCEEFFSDSCSVLAPEKPELDHALRFIRKGDVLVATRLDRIAPTIARLLEVYRALEAKSAELRILSMRLDSSTPNGQLMLHALGAAAELEQFVAREREQGQRSAPKDVGGRDAPAKLEAVQPVRARPPAADAQKPNAGPVLAPSAAPPSNDPLGQSVAQALGVA